MASAFHAGKTMELHQVGTRLAVWRMSSCTSAESDGVSSALMIAVIARHPSMNIASPMYPAQYANKRGTSEGKISRLERSSHERKPSRWQPARWHAKA